MIHGVGRRTAPRPVVAQVWACPTAVGCPGAAKVRGHPNASNEILCGGSSTGQRKRPTTDHGEADIPADYTTFQSTLTLTKGGDLDKGVVFDTPGVDTDANASIEEACQRPFSQILTGYGKYAHTFTNAGPNTSSTR